MVPTFTFDMIHKILSRMIYEPKVDIVPPLVHLSVLLLLTLQFTIGLYWLG